MSDSKPWIVALLRLQNNLSLRAVAYADINTYQLITQVIVELQTSHFVYSLLKELNTLKSKTGF